MLVQAVQQTCHHCGKAACRNDFRQAAEFGHRGYLDNPAPSHPSRQWFSWHFSANLPPVEPAPSLSDVNKLGIIRPGNDLPILFFRIEISDLVQGQFHIFSPGLGRDAAVGQEKFAAPLEKPF